MVGVYTNGVRLQAIDIQSPDSSWPLEASAFVHLRARYYPERNNKLWVQFWVDGQAGEKSWIMEGVDLAALFGDQPVTVGFLIQSGNSGENHDVTFFYMLGSVADVTGSYGGAKLGLKWPYVARGVDCNVQWSPSLVAPDWKTLAVPTMLGGINGATLATEYLTQVPATNSPSFFRLIGK